MSSGIQRITPLAALLIVTLTTGCDNVDWGGIQVSVVRPAPRGGQLATAETAPGERLPEGPVLYYVRVDSAGRRGVIQPVAEIQDGGLRRLRPVDPAVYEPAFISQHFDDGTRFTLFHHGQPSGTLTVDSAAPAAPGACHPLPDAMGGIRLDRNRDAREFLALLRPRTATARTATPEPPGVDRRMRILAPILANQMLDARDATLPTSWSHALAQITSFPVRGSDDAAFAATFLVGDTLAPGFDDVGESLFFIAVPQAQVGYDTVFVRFADYARTGRSAPRVIDYLDWNHDGQPDLLLDVYTTGPTRFMAIGPTHGDWRVLLDDTCEPPATADTTTATQPQPAATQPAPAPPRRARRTQPDTTARLPQVEPRIRMVGTDTTHPDTVPPPIS